MVNTLGVNTPEKVPRVPLGSAESGLACRSFPVLSFSPEVISRYLVRKAVKDNQLATAEVAARALELIGESDNAGILDLLFETFKENYMLGKSRKPLPAGASQFILAGKLKLLP